MPIVHLGSLLEQLRRTTVNAVVALDDLRETTPVVGLERCARSFDSSASINRGRYDAVESSAFGAEPRERTRRSSKEQQ